MFFVLLLNEYLSFSYTQLPFFFHLLFLVKTFRTLLGYYETFAWQDGYGAFSVSPSLLDKTKKYIARQAEHHKKTTLREEYKMILDRYGIEYDDNYFLCD